MVILVYPLFGVVLFLARRTRQRTLGQDPLPIGGVDHVRVAVALASAVVLITLLALAVVIGTQAPPETAAGGPGLLLVLVALGSLVSLLTLLRVRQPAWRAVFALLCWAGLLGLGSQPQVWRLSDNPLSASFWQSHYWGGLGLNGLLLLFLAARPEIRRQSPWRRLHATAGVLAALIVMAQAASGSRDLLEIPLSWQKPTVFACDPIRRTCPPLLPPPPPLSAPAAAPSQPPAS